MSASNNNAAAYWAENVKLLTICLVIWAICSYGFGIILVEPLNAIHIGGYPLGFFFAQQGSIYVFLALVFFYAARMNALDKKYDFAED
jgi:putative solute:sodium symporter small subunit